MDAAAHGGSESRPCAGHGGVIPDEAYIVDTVWSLNKSSSRRLFLFHLKGRFEQRGTDLRDRFGRAERWEAVAEFLSSRSEAPDQEYAEDQGVLRVCFNYAAKNGFQRPPAYRRLRPRPHAGGGGAPAAGKPAPYACANRGFHGDRHQGQRPPMGRE